MKFGIATKLFIFFFFFILIFYGTVFDLLIKVQDMSRLSARIVSINHQIAALSENLRDNLIDMDANIKKFKVLKKDQYFEYFETARAAYTGDLNRIISLDAGHRGLPEHSASWIDIYKAYADFTLSRPRDALEKMTGPWIEPPVLTRWLEAIAGARKQNDTRIEQSLILINSRSRQVMRNALVGFGISVFVGISGILFITRSMLTPLKKLKSGLKHVSDDNYTHKITIDSGDEFGEVAAAFNDMSRQLKADEEIRSDFIATLSHEIRTPLSSIRESVNMITEELLGPVTEKQKKFLNIAGDEIARITGLLNHLLDTSMLPDGEEKPARIPLDPNLLAGDAVKRLSATARSNDIIMGCTALEDAPKVMADQKEIMQVLMNLLGNALKFSCEKGQVDVRISRGPGKGYLTFHISDTGPGIPREKQDLIFKKYYRAEEVRKHMDGVGLGLSIARRIILAHGGRIFVKNNDDKGSTFSFTLPVQKKE